MRTDRAICPAAVLFCAAAFPAPAQPAEFGFTLAYAGGGAADLPYRSFGSVGFQGCGFCDRRFAVFGDYRHLFATETVRTQITSFDLVSGGLRIQGRRRVRPFVDVGAVVGVDRFTYSAGQGSHASGGFVVCGGARLPVTDRVYLRPEVRLFATTGFHAVFTVGAAIGISPRPR